MDAAVQRHSLSSPLPSQKHTLTIKHIVPTHSIPCTPFLFLAFMIHCFLNTTSPSLSMSSLSFQLFQTNKVLYYFHLSFISNNQFFIVMFPYSLHMLEKKTPALPDLLPPPVNYVSTLLVSSVMLHSFKPSHTSICSQALLSRTSYYLLTFSIPNLMFTLYSHRNLLTTLFIKIPNNHGNVSKACSKPAFTGKYFPTLLSLTHAWLSSLKLISHS